MGQRPHQRASAACMHVGVRAAAHTTLCTITLCWCLQGRGEPRGGCCAGCPSPCVFGPVLSALTTHPPHLPQLDMQRAVHTTTIATLRCGCAAASRHAACFSAASLSPDLGWGGVQASRARAACRRVERALSASSVVQVRRGVASCGCAQVLLGSSSPRLCTISASQTRQPHSISTERAL